MPTACDLYQKSLDQRFHEFHAANPKVYDLFVKFAEEAKAKGRKRIGAKMLAERIRWYTTVETVGEDVKINNSYVSRYARMVGLKRPDLLELFEMRKLKSA